MGKRRTLKVFRCLQLILQEARSWMARYLDTVYYTILQIPEVDIQTFVLHLSFPTSFFHETL
jgi:hypothetical protein